MSAPTATTYQGQCHCGALEVAYESAVAAAETQVRECQCSFCRLHASMTVSDPKGRIRFTEARPGSLKRYRFGLKTAQSLLCAHCGAYMGALMSSRDGAQYAIVNIRTLADRARFTQPPQAMVYDGEDAAARIARREQKWTPAAVG